MPVPGLGSSGRPGLVGPGWGSQPSDLQPSQPNLHSQQGGCRAEYIRVRLGGQDGTSLGPGGASSLQFCPLPWPSACPSSSLPAHPPSAITPKGKLWQEGAGLGPSHPFPGILGLGRRHSREKPSSELKFGDCQCQEKLNNPVTSMKVNSRSAAHGKYECSVSWGE